MEVYKIIFFGYFIFYLLLIRYLFRSSTNAAAGYDMLKIKIRFLPFHARWFGVLIFIAGIVISYYLKDVEEFTWKKEFFSYNLFTGFLLFLLSKERDEDELFLHLRIKSLAVSLINMLLFAGLIYAFIFMENKKTESGIINLWNLDLGFWWFWWLLLPIHYFTYFYYSKYKSQKEQQ